MAAQPPIPASLWNTIAPEAQAAILAHIASLEQRIADLEAENADLRRRLARSSTNCSPSVSAANAPPIAVMSPRVRAPTAGARNIVGTPDAFGPSPRPAPPSSNMTSVLSDALIAARATSNPPASSKTISSPISPNPNSSGIATDGTSTVVGLASGPARAAVIWNCPAHTSARAPACSPATAAPTSASPWVRPGTCSTTSSG